MKVRIMVMSDLHVRFPGARGFPPLAPGTDLIAIAGDTCEGLQSAIRHMRSAYPTKQIVTVAGNHEFYRTTYGEELDAGRKCANELGVYFLENNAIASGDFGRLRIIGASLWTDYGVLGEALRLPAMREAQSVMRDHKRINWRKTPWERFRPQEARMLHLISRDYIEKELARPHNGPTLVITHHAPLLDAVEPTLRNRLISAAYASDLGSIIDKYQPDYWISGHTHYSLNMLRGRTRLVSNPCGYGEENGLFDPALSIEVDA